MKKLLILPLLIFTAFNSNAQFKALGVKLGVNYGAADIKEHFNSGGTDYTYATEEADVGLAFGLFARAKVHHFFFQPELLASNHETRMKLSSIKFDSLMQLKQTRVDIPLLFGYSRKDRIRAFTGPVFTKLTQNPVFSEKFFRDELGSVFNGGTWAWQLGFSFDMGPLMVDARFETNLGSLSDHVQIKGQNFNFDHRMNTIQVSIGWDFVH
ncbi:MAG: outer membrane beta-barrel protein [Bacteroidetes bacterium]|nr:outer membrane beta-barrel protein [Bacteroidota bacterium]